MSELGPRLDDFAELPLWVAWQGEPAERPDAPPKKVPYSANGRTGRASATDPKTWGARRAAIARAAALPKPCGLGGIGVVLTEIADGNWLCGIDLDTCRDPRSGNLAPWAEEVVTRFASYTEVSPSRTGIKLFFCMRAPDRDTTLSEIRAINGEPGREGNKWAHGTGEDHPPAIELYLGKRYFTVTGDKMEGVPEQLRVVDAATVGWLVGDAGPAFSRRGANRNGRDPDGQPRDDSRSAEAMRIGYRMAREDKSYDEFCGAVRDTPETADWYREKGIASGGRELKRIWKKVTKNNATDNRYQIINGVLCYKKWNGDGTIDNVQLANFGARITEEQILDDGAVKTRRYRVSGALADGTPLPDAIIDATQKFSNTSWVNEHWGARAIVYPGAGTQMLEAAIKTVSGHVPCRQTYAHLGWRVVDGDWVYLHAGGAIGRDGAVDGINVEIKGTLAHCVLPPITDIQVAVRSSLEMLDLKTGTVVAAATYRAPLGLLSPTTLSVHLAGKTGSLKSALAGVAQAHWGDHWNGVQFPANWTDTANDLEVKAFTAKDTLFGVDEFMPRGRSRRQIEELCGKAERLYRGQANQSGRGRLDANIKERPVYWPQGLTMSSGEDIPEGHSLRARIMIIQVEKRDIDPDQLRRLQAAGSSGLLAQAMAGYVQWLAGRVEELRPWFAQRKEELRHEAIGAHRRTPQNYAELVIGCEVYLAFAADVGAITEKRRDELLKLAKEELQNVMRAQDDEQRSEDVVEIFLGALGDALAGGRVYVADWHSKDAPLGFEEACGWRLTPYHDAQGEERQSWRAQGDRVGWLAGGTKLYVITDAAYACVERLLNRPLVVTKNTLIKRLGEAGVIAEHDPDKNGKLISNEGEKIRVLALKADRVLLSGLRRTVVEGEDVPF